MSSAVVHDRSANLDLAKPHHTASRCAADLSSHQSNINDQGPHSWFSGGLPTPPASKDMTGVSLASNYGSHSQPQPYSNGYNTQPYSTHSRTSSGSYSTTRYNPSSDVKFDFGAVEKSKVNAIASHLQIPESVNKSKGSLAEFAAEITCLFWFESAATLEYAERLPADAALDRGLVPDAAPTLGFRKWVTTILTTTQVGKNVILLALMFIYRLKKFNPSVSGKRGSEFRLLTIALMLGNKFLDDNTYTNKTWAEVSGISVTEIHIMEVEFLSNMRYELYASQAEWVRWKTLLGKFGSFYEKATKFQHQEDQRPNPPITPTSQTFGYKLPSPPSGHLNPVHNATNYNALPNPMTTLPQLPKSPVRQYTPSGVPSERKRSIDATDSLPPAKRLHYSINSSTDEPPIALTPISEANTNSVFNGAAGPFASGARIPQLPMPRLPPSTAGMGMHLAPLTLPSSRAMASVYPPVTAAWSQPVTPISAVPPAISSQFHNSVAPTPEVARIQTGTTDSAHTSPINMYGPVTPTRQGLSPSYFLTNRSSPYRPVRHVNTLLIPPPSAAMQTPVRNIGYEQMHYQPLGRPSERRTGTVPYYQPEGWNQSNVSTPTTTLYRPF